MIHLSAFFWIRYTSIPMLPVAAWVAYHHRSLMETTTLSPFIPRSLGIMNKGSLLTNKNYLRSRLILPKGDIIFIEGHSMALPTTTLVVGCSTIPLPPPIWHACWLFSLNLGLHHVKITTNVVADALSQTSIDGPCAETIPTSMPRVHDCGSSRY